MSALFQPYSMRELHLDNRIVVSPMCQYSAKDGTPVPWHTVHLGGLAIGGAALMFLEATAVTPGGRITPGCLGLYHDDNEAGIAALLTTLRSISPIKIGIQLSHAGRKASSETPWNGGQLIPVERGGWRPLGPSAIPQIASEDPPIAMNDDDLAQVLDAFVAAARRVVRLGFDAVEIHAAHGYLLHEFLSPVANQRTDRYGGSFENRIRFPLEVFQAVRQVVPAAIPVGVRLSASDWMEHSGQESWTLDQSVRLAGHFKTLGCDWIDVSSAGISPLQKIVVGPGYQVPFSQAVKQASGMTTISVGMITDAKQADAIIEHGQADLVALARAMLYDPHWAWRAAQTLQGSVVGPKQYWRSLPAGSGRVFGDISVGQR